MNAPGDAPMHVVIMGAGPAGLATGHELVAHGVAVTVLERNDYVGGLCRTVHESGYRFDLGGHRWFTKNEDLNDWFRDLMEGELVMVQRISRIYYGGKYYMYPVAIGDVIKNAGLITSIQAAFSFLWAAVRYAAFNRPIRNMKDGYTAQFGSTLYEMFFRRYTEKVWGRPCEELSADWIAQRSKGLSIWTVARQALSTRKSDVESLVEEFMYPRDGYMRIPERMAEDIEGAGSRVLLNASVKGIVVHGPNDIEVAYGTPDGSGRTLRNSFETDRRSNVAVFITNTGGLFFLFAHIANKIGRDAARNEGVDTDLVGRQLERQGLGKRRHARAHHVREGQVRNRLLHR